MFKSALTDTTYNNLVYDPDMLWALKKRMPIMNIERYYPKQIRDLLEKNNVEFDFSLPPNISGQIIAGTDT